MRLILAAALCALPTVASAQPYHYAINQAASSLTYTLNFSGPFQTSPSGSSYIVGTAAGADAIPGNADDTASPPSTRTITGLFGADPGTNQLINLTNGSITANGSNGSTPLHPTGAFDASFHTGTGSVTVTNLNSSLLGGGTATIGANASITYPSFRERNPSCLIVSIGAIAVPIGDITASSITASQTAAASGTLTPVSGQPGRYTFSVDVPVVINVTATFAGAPAPIDPQAAVLTLAVSVDLSQPGAPVSAQVSTTQTQDVPGPIAIDPLTFTEPVCNGTLAIKLTLASTSTTISLSSSLSAAGTASPCGAADIGRQGGLPGYDGVLDNNDFVVFIEYFFTSNPLADRGRTGGLPGSDGAFDNNDFVVFIDQFFAGC